ncbi:hypothetical protein D1122_01490 [Cereibacter sphaeroides]|uniref:hypothetical protein n=1 Tax=Cereibacter sphaeroides TaxID=1063 RepID=UPI000E5BCFF7|nr:hypothetical protein [Cereibacter sphaeroides]RIA01362.1 hypothetical protein D1122_01490 [Cereibacter sphaeroides]
MPHKSAFPVLEITRHHSTEGITVHELTTALILSGHAAHAGVAAIGPEEVNAAKHVADLALQHRRAQP